MSIENFTQTAQQLIQDVIAVTASVPDAIDALIDLLQNPGEKVNLLSGDDVVNAQESTRDMLRRITLLSVVDQARQYRPTSYDDAILMKQRVCALLDHEILIAADRGECEVYLALRRLKAGTVVYLMQKGADLSAMREVHSETALPAPVLAQQLYQDSTRTDQLSASAGVPHPAFMPTHFKALSE